MVCEKVIFDISDIWSLRNETKCVKDLQIFIGILDRLFNSLFMLFSTFNTYRLRTFEGVSILFERQCRWKLLVYALVVKTRDPF